MPFRFEVGVVLDFARFISPFASADADSSRLSSMMRGLPTGATTDASAALSGQCGSTVSLCRGVRRSARRQHSSCIHVFDDGLS